jgi:hypothetical protein
MASLKNDAKTDISGQVEPLKQTEARLQTEERKLAQFKSESTQLSEWIGQRFFWSDVLSELARVLQQTETIRKEDMGGVENGVWIESFTSATPGLSGPVEEVATGEEPSQRMAMSLAMMRRYGLIPRDMVAAPDTPAPADGTAAPADATTAPADATTAPADGTPATPPPKPAASTNEIAVINVQCRGLNLRKTDPAANDKLAFELEKQLQASPLFDAKETKLTGDKNVEEGALTFTFKVQLKLKRPLKL